MKKKNIIIKFQNQELWFESLKKAAEFFGCSKSTILNILYHENYLNNRFGIKQIWLSNENKEKI